MRITFDPVKRDNTLAERGLDFADAAIVFAGVTLEIEDTRLDYGEDPGHLLWPAGGSDGRGGLHAAWRGPPHLQHEESQ
jgi:hypothetical protein